MTCSIRPDHCPIVPNQSWSADNALACKVTGATEAERNETVEWGNEPVWQTTERTTDRSASRPVRALLMETVKQALVVLVGVTADARKRDFLARHLAAETDNVVLVPPVPQWRGLSCCAGWLDGYFKREGIFAEFDQVHFLNYISGGYMFRSVASSWPNERIGRIIYCRGPIQERVPAALIEKYTRIGILLTQGKMVVDLAETWIDQLPYPATCHEQGLIIETGVSQLAASLGLSTASVVSDEWKPHRLLPGANDVIRVPESHDDVYTSETFLGAVLNFFRSGHFKVQGAVS